MSMIQKELVDVVARINDDDAVLVLDFLRRFVVDDDFATEQDLLDITAARADFQNGETVSLSDYLAKNE